MGQAAEDRLDGTCCESCGEFFDDIHLGAEAPGFPRYCVRCQPAAEGRPGQGAKTAAQRRAASERRRRKRQRLREAEAAAKAGA